MTCLGISDALSGVNTAEYYYDVDPGVGQGYAMSLNGSTATATTSLGLPKGSHSLYCRVQDNAGNWSSSSQPAILTVLN